MAALPTVEQLTFLLAMRLTTEPWSGRTAAEVPVLDYTVEVERDDIRSGYEAFVWCGSGNEMSEFVLNSYDSGIWPGDVTYPSLEAAVTAILAAVCEHRAARRR